MPTYTVALSTGQLVEAEMPINPQCMQGEAYDAERDEENGGDDE